jgi:translation initiation factor 2 subunit 1
MNAEKEEFPESGDLVIATVKAIAPYGAYVTLDEYNDKEGLLHTSEVSSTWVKNIRDHVREGQKVVLKVLRVDIERKHIDLSLRRVAGPERREKLLEWKHDRKAESLLKMAAEKLGITPEAFYEKAGRKIEDYYRGLYEGLEEAAELGEEALTKAGVPGNMAKVLAEIAQAKIRLPKVTIRGVLELTCFKPNGVDIIRRALINAKNIEKPPDTKTEIYVIGAPRYRVEIQARNYRDAERLLSNISETVIQAIEKSGGKGAFKRE